MLNSHLSCHPFKTARLFFLFLFVIILIPVGNLAWGKPCTEGCDDNEPCTLDYCSSGQCVNSPRVYSPCEDDGNPCTMDVCNSSGQCEPVPKPGSPCEDDGNPCTMDVCNSSGQCDPVPKPGSPCDRDGDPCTFDACDSKGKCNFMWNQRNGYSCDDDGDSCTVDSCDDGICTFSGITLELDGCPCEDDDIECSIDVFKNGECKHIFMPMDPARPEYVLYDGEKIQPGNIQEDPICEKNIYYEHTIEDLEGNRFTKTCDGQDVILFFTRKDGVTCNEEAARCSYPKARNRLNIRGTFQHFTGAIWLSEDEETNCYWQYAIYTDTCCLFDKEICED
jgi:hypothetical protein